MLGWEWERKFHFLRQIGEGDQQTLEVGARVSNDISEGKVLQGEGKVSIKMLRPEYAWSIQKTRSQYCRCTVE